MGRFDDVVREIGSRQGTENRAQRLENFSRALAALDLSLKDRAPSVALVAGTNGKGTTAKTLETLLIRGGFSVGLFTSPHLIDTTERIRSHGQDLDREEFVAVYERVRPLVERWGLSHFETLSLMMADVFFGGRIRKPVDRAILEVGVGGRWDPTRVFPHALCAFARFGLDHQALLGPTLSDIAREKFAIVEADHLVVHLPFPDEIQSEVRAAQLRAPQSQWIEAERLPFEVLEGPTWVMRTPVGPVPLVLQGERAVEDASLALRAADVWGVPATIAAPALSEVRWPGRMEAFVERERKVYLSGDHNEQGVRSLAEILRHHRYRRLILLLGIAAGKDLDRMLGAFADLNPAEMILTTTPFRPIEQYNLRPLQERIQVIEDPRAAWKRALDLASGDDLLLVSGSFYLVGLIRSWLVRAGRV